MKTLMFVMMALMATSQVAKADDELTCGTDNSCIQDKVEAGEKEFKRQQRRERRQKRKAAKEADVPPCAGDDDCQRTGQDAADRERGIKGQED